MFQGYRRSIALAALCLSCSLFSGPSRVAASEPATLWHFLGIPQAMKHIHLQTVNRFGHHPGLEPKPPLRAIADPANLTAGVTANPPAGAASPAGVALASLRNAEPPDADPALEAVRKAAQIKQAEDMAPQKIKALRYLASIGCRDPEVADALSKSMDIQHERVERVRYAAVQAIIDSAGDQCAHCNTDTCCTRELLETMAMLAFGRDGQGCWLEPSDRVREAMQEALQKCCPASFPIIEVPRPIPPVDPPHEAPRPPRDATEEENDEDLLGIGRREWLPSQAGTETEARWSLLMTDVDETSIQPVGLIRQGEQRSDFRSLLSTAQGAVLRIDSEDQSVLIRCPDEGRAIEGTLVTVRRSFLTGPASIGTLKVVSVEPGYVVAVPHRMTRAVKPGDEVVLFMQVR
jgi:hypothetical protein